MSDPAAGRVRSIIFGLCVGLGVSTTAVFARVGAPGDFLAFVLLTLYLLAALLFTWGWRTESALLGVTIVPWVLAIPGLVEGGFPGVLRPDPFLLDGEREALGATPARAANGAATAQLSLFAPAQEAAPGGDARARVPTTHDRLLEARAGHSLPGLHDAWIAARQVIGANVALARRLRPAFRTAILSNADMPGFSRDEQARIARVVLAHRGKLAKIEGLPARSPDWALVFCLRVAALFYRSRVELELPRLAVRATDSGYQLAVPAQWLEAHPLTAAALEAEAEEWRNVGLRFDVRAQAERAQAAG